MGEVISANSSSGEDIASAFREPVLKAIESLGPEVDKISLKIHSNPELCFKEEIACRAVADFMKNRGFGVEEGIADLKTAFRAVAGNTSKQDVSIAFLAEYDALKGIGHGCGHNLIAGASMLAASAVKTVLDPLPGRLQLIGTPAEEGGGGKIVLANAGVFNNLDAVMMAHPSTTTSIFKRSLGCMEVDAVFKGQPAHAAAEPWKGRNALDALILSFNAINALRQHIKPDARIHGIITRGGEAVNVIPETASGQFLVRALSMKYVKELYEKLKQCFEGAAAQTGCEVEVSINEAFVYEPFNPNHALGKIFQKNIESMGFIVEQGSTDKGLGSSDIGNVSSRVPCIHPEFYIGIDSVPFHSREFAAAAAEPKALKAMRDVAAAMAMTAIELFKRPEALVKIKEEHDSKEDSIK